MSLKRKVIASAVAATVAASTLAIAASANSIFVPDTIDPGANIGNGMYLVQLYNVGNEAENKPATDYGIDVEAVASITVTFHPDENDFDFDLDAGTYGGGIVPSCNGGIAPTGSDLYNLHNWPGNYQWWGLGSVASEDQPIAAVDNGDGSYTLTAVLTEDTKFLAGTDCCQIAFQEWGTGFAALYIDEVACWDAAGNKMISFDGSGVATVGGTAAPAETEAVVDTNVADEAVADTTTADTTATAGNTTTATTDKASPDTGIADVAAIAGLGIIAVGALVVAKKRK